MSKMVGRIGRERKVRGVSQSEAKKRRPVNVGYLPTGTCEQSTNTNTIAITNRDF